MESKYGRFGRRACVKLMKCWSSFVVGSIDFLNHCMMYDTNPLIYPRHKHLMDIQCKLVWNRVVDLSISSSSYYDFVLHSHLPQRTSSPCPPVHRCADPWKASRKSYYYRAPAIECVPSANQSCPVPTDAALRQRVANVASKRSTDSMGACWAKKSEREGKRNFDVINIQYNIQIVNSQHYL